jgi:hypothetical protein
MKDFLKTNLFYAIFIIFCALIMGGGSYVIDFYWRPWAYSSDKNAPLFVGKWTGKFKDPDGVSKEISIEIFTPKTNAERFLGALNCNGKHTKSRRSFDGKATVISTLGEENYEIWGNFKNTDFHEFYFSARYKESLKSANFYLKETDSNCTWKGDEMTLILPFSYQKADGSGYFSSDDARFTRKATCVMVRK